MLKKSFIVFGIVFIIVLTIILILAGSYTGTFYDSFEDGVAWTYWTETAGTGWDITNDGACGLGATCAEDGGKCACTESGATDVLTMKSNYSLVGYNDCSLTYYTYVDSSFDNGESLLVDVLNSTNGWTNIYSCTNGQACEDNAWHQQTYNITTGVGLIQNFSVRVQAVNNDATEEAGFDKVNITCYNATGGGDTCSYSSGNWAVNCSDNCTISSNVAGGNNNFSAVGSGTFTITGNISGFKRYFIGGGCRAICKGGCIRV